MTRSIGMMGVWMLVAVVGCGGGAVSGEPPATATESTVTRAPLDRSNTECVPAALAETEAASQSLCLLRATETDHLFAALNLHDALVKKMSTLEGRLGAEGTAAVVAEIDRLFKTERLQQELETRVIAAYDVDQARLLLGYYGSDAGRTYAALGAQEPDDEALGAFIEADALTDARRALIARLRVAAHIADLVDAMVMVPLHEMTKAMLPLAPPGAVAPDESQLRGAAAPMVSALDHAMTMTMAYMLRDLSDADLEAIVTAEEGAAAQWFTGARLAALRAVLVEAYQGLGQAIGQNMPPSTAAAAPVAK